jgi:hypothetical protein
MRRELLLEIKAVAVIRKGIELKTLPAGPV